MKLEELRKFFTSKREKTVFDKNGDPLYKISVDGEDAIIHFGIYGGREVSRIAREDFSYLNALVKQGHLPEELMDVLQHVRAKELARRTRKNLGLE